MSQLRRSPYAPLGLSRLPRLARLPHLVVPLAVALTVALGACSASDAAYTEAAEKVITGEISEQAGLGELDASCEKPASTEVGEQFACSATTADGATIELLATIDEDDKVNVVSTNLLTAEAVEQIEQIARDALVDKYGGELGPDSLDCGSTAVVIDVTEEVLSCTFVDPADDKEYDATIDVPDLQDIGSLTVQIADQPRA